MAGGTQQRKPVLRYHTRQLCMQDCVIMKYSVLWTGQSMFPSVALWKPSVSQIYRCLHTHTSSRGYQRPYRGQILCCLSCVFVLCPALSCSASLLGGSVSSSHTVTLTQQRKSDDPEHQFPLCSPFASFQAKLFPQKHCPPPPNPFLDVKHLMELKLTRSCLAGCSGLSSRQPVLDLQRCWCCILQAKKRNNCCSFKVWIVSE